MNIDEAAVRLQAICAQWGMPLAEVKRADGMGRPRGHGFVRIAITCEFVAAMEPWINRPGYRGSGKVTHADMALLLNITDRSFRRYLAELRRWLPVTHTGPVTARAMPTVEMTGPNRASLEEQVLGGGLQ